MQRYWVFGLWQIFNLNVRKLRFLFYLCHIWDEIQPLICEAIATLLNHTRVSHFLKGQRFWTHLVVVRTYSSTYTKEWYFLKIFLTVLEVHVWGWVFKLWMAMCKESALISELSCFHNSLLGITLKLVMFVISNIHV